MIMTNKWTKLYYYPFSISICTVEKFAHICVPILQSDLAQKETDKGFTASGLLYDAFKQPFSIAERTNDSAQHLSDIRAKYCTYAIIIGFVYVGAQTVKSSSGSHVFTRNPHL